MNSYQEQNTTIQNIGTELEKKRIENDSQSTLRQPNDSTTPYDFVPISKKKKKRNRKKRQIIKFSLFMYFIFLSFNSLLNYFII